MKFFVILGVLLALNSCNTLIGIGRDTRIAYDWTKTKIQESNADHQGGGDYETAPVY